MKKSLRSLIVLVTIATTIHNTTNCLPPADQKKQVNNDVKATQLTKDIQTKMESAQNASTAAEQQRLNDELKNDIDQATTYFDSVQNFFGYGPLAEKRRAQAEQEKSTLEQKLFLEKAHFKTLRTDADKEKSLKRQTKLKNQIHTEKIALGQAWSLKQKALAAALAGATAYLGYQYGGQAVSAAKKTWLASTPQAASSKKHLTGRDYEDFISSGNEDLPKGTWKKFMKAGALDIPREPLTPENLETINPEDYIQVSTNYIPSITNTEISKSWGKWAQDQAYYFYNLLPSLRSTATNE